ncbi:MAG: glycosyltransferase family 2 protein [Chloroflexi bacterium HGW-Chloroflexi-6]|nr:MAG: glycosyltransferase family 2 protein [Chloroflexi bacterium HGW-Chloroflexi-6]
MRNLAVLLTVHNRKAKTLACLESFFIQQNLPEDLRTQVILVDDGCSDGTPDAIQRNFPQVEIITGTGKLFWCGGMRLAFDLALQKDFDFYLWLNDDTFLFSDALARLLSTSSQFSHQAIIVASTQDQQTKELTYGGVKRASFWYATRFYQVAPTEEPISVDTMNGNCVLIPKFITQKVGNLDSVFTHGIGDYDYGLRARNVGLNVILAPNYYGYCQRNQPNKTSSWQHRLKRTLSPHGLPPREWAIFTKRHAGWLWPVFWLSPYINVIFKNGEK